MSEDNKQYDKEAPLAEHARELTKQTLENRPTKLRDQVARSINDACLAGKLSTSFIKGPTPQMRDLGYTDAMFNMVYQELATKGYKLDYSGDSLVVSWE